MVAGLYFQFCISISMVAGVSLQVSAMGRRRVYLQVSTSWCIVAGVSLQFCISISVVAGV